MKKKDSFFRLRIIFVRKYDLVWMLIHSLSSEKKVRNNFFSFCAVPFVRHHHRWVFPATRCRHALTV